MSESTTDQTSTTQEQTVTVMVTRDEFAQMLTAMANDAAGSATFAVNDSVSSQLETIREDVASMGTVSIAPEQYEQYLAISASGLHAQVVIVGLLSLLLGAVIATAVTLHWRGRG